MKSQIFKCIVPITILFELLEKICVKDEKNYHLCKSAFKAAEYHNLVNGFCAKLIEYYHVSKRHYVEKKMNYNSFVTVARQICSANNVEYTSKIVYSKSDYEILYFISKTPSEVNIAQQQEPSVPSPSVENVEVNVPKAPRKQRVKKAHSVPSA